MAVIIPILAVYGGVTAGMAVAAGAALTFGSAMAIAGGMAAGLGLVTGNKDFQRLGSQLSAVGGIANALAGAGGATAAAGADGGADAATSAAWAEGAGKGGDTLQAAGGPVGSEVGNIAQAGSELGANFAGVDASGRIQSPMGGGMGASPSQIAADLTGNSNQSLAQSFSTAPTQAVTAEGLAATSAPNALEQAASGMTKADIAGYGQSIADKASSLMGQAWDGAGQMLNSAGQWVQKNPAASNMLFKAVEGMYGPESEALDYKKSLIERARQNMNSPVRMQYRTPVTVGG